MRDISFNLFVRYLQIGITTTITPSKERSYILYICWRGNSDIDEFHMNDYLSDNLVDIINLLLLRCNKCFV